MMVDCHQNSSAAIRALARKVHKKTKADVNVVLTADLRAHPQLLSKVILKGEVLKDTEGQWEQLQSEAGAIIAAGDQEQQQIESEIAQVLKEFGLLADE
jgi:hypothetical protein